MKKKDSKNAITKAKTDLKMKNQNSNIASENLNNSENHTKPQNNYPTDIQNLFERLGLI